MTHFTKTLINALGNFADYYIQQDEVTRHHILDEALNWSQHNTLKNDLAAVRESLDPHEPTAKDMRESANYDTPEDASKYKAIVEAREKLRDGTETDPTKAVVAFLDRMAEILP